MDESSMYGLVRRLKAETRDAPTRTVISILADLREKLPAGNLLKEMMARFPNELKLMALEKLDHDMMGDANVLEAILEELGDPHRKLLLPRLLTFMNWIVKRGTSSRGPEEE